MEPPTDKNHTDARTGPATTSSVEDHRAGLVSRYQSSRTLQTPHFCQEIGILEIRER